MKSFKLLSVAFFAIIALSITSCDTDSNASEPSFTVTEINYSATGNASDSDILAKVYVENTSEADITLHWVRQNVSVPAGWETAICDHNLCYPTATNEKDLVLTAGQKIELKFTFYPNDTEGTGTSDLVIYDTADQDATTATYSFSATARP